MKQLLIKEIKKYHPSFPEDELEIGLSKFQLKHFTAKEIISERGKVTSDLFFTEKSISRCFYFDEEGQEQTLWMKPEQTFFTEFKSFINQDPSMFGLQLYEDSDAYCISREDLQQLYQESKEWAYFGVSMTEKLHVTLIDVFVNLLANDATRNYQYIEYMFPRFIQVAPLKDIASMLQISQVSLSRIRSGTQLKT